MATRPDQTSPVLNTMFLKIRYVVKSVIIGLCKLSTDRSLHVQPTTSDSLLRDRRHCVRNQVHETADKSIKLS